MSTASSPIERTENERCEKVEQKITAIPRGCDNARVEQVIVTRALKGAGTEDDPCRTDMLLEDIETNERTDD